MLFVFVSTFREFLATHNKTEMEDTRAGVRKITRLIDGLNIVPRGHPCLSQKHLEALFCHMSGAHSILLT